MAISLFTVNTAEAQSVFYQFDIKDTSTYSYNCGSTSSSFWRVVDDSCSITFETDSLPDCQSPILIPVEITINSTGNLNCEDEVYMEYSCGTSWIHFDTLQGCTLNSVQTYNYNISCVVPNIFKLRITFDTDHNTEKLDIRDGHITIFDPCGITLPISIYDLELSEDGISNVIKWRIGGEDLPQEIWVEKSLNGRTFYIDGAPQVMASGSEDPYYSYSDEESGKRVYYRIGWQTDGGNTEYSEILATKDLFNSETPVVYYDIGRHALMINSSDDLNGNVEVFNLSGQLVHSSSFKLSGSGSVSIPVPAHIRGMHIALVRQNDQIIRHRFYIP